MSVYPACRKLESREETWEELLPLLLDFLRVWLAEQLTDRLLGMEKGDGSIFLIN